MKHTVIIMTAGLLACFLNSPTTFAATGARTQRTFTGKGLQEIAFPLGGIGTGSISLGGRGTPAKG